MSYYPVYGFSSGQLAELDAALRDALETWGQRWFTAPLGFSVVETGAEDRFDPVTFRSLSGGQQIGFHSQEISESLFAALFHCPKSEQSPTTLKLTEPVQTACQQELFALLLKADGGDEQEQAPPAGFAEKWSGWHKLIMVWPDESLLVVYLSPGLIRSQWLKHQEQTTQPALASRAEAIGQQRLSLTAELGSVSLPVGELARLQAGDVIFFNPPVAESITLKTSTEHCIARGQLCQHQGHRALLLRGADTPDHNHAAKEE
ncbi:FliM/FliN family flagellar motor C-terminal domain-containing protein [Parendozoicomonas haliclonae]|uniref:Surface presentation of antigens (SPOA) n=1 Tax=Parendozoicomonas haliclonae TaxID=1960125 RepID=A0A1X7AP73_9GAMM|nr:FliM/FliN family flagellar motor C-terminal domain-containing protein [Parendozoicomonas haliclonae]SMA49890.1 Surface presentation of antigens (SPOA) [Parendozoicomonas haliclonae]